MPYDDPEPDDPLVLVGVELPGDESTTREMAAVFAEEFARMGLSRARILALYRTPFYAGAHDAWRWLGEDEIAWIVDNTLRVYGRVSYGVRDSEIASSEVNDTVGEEAGPGPLVARNGSLRMLR